MAEIVYVRDVNGNLVQTTIEDLGENRLEQLEEENKNLKEEIEIQKKLNLGERTEYLKCIEELKEENKKLRETIKDHQLYEEKLEHRIIEFEELLHGE